jgi:hypothetical protein
MTQDIDLSLLTGFGNEETYIKELLETFEARIPNALDFALKNRVLLLSASNGVAVDVSRETSTSFLELQELGLSKDFFILCT